MGFEWIDGHSNKYAQALNGKIFTDGDIPGEVITPSKKKGRHRDKD